MKQFTQPHRSLWWFLCHCINWPAVCCWIIYPACVFIIIIVAFFTFVCCSTPKIVENHHHHYVQADTLAVQALVDKQLTSWHAQMDSSWRQSWQEYSASWFSYNDEKEKVTETITTFVDSLGREVRQEQRTTERSLSRMQQQTEQQLSREFEARLRTTLDSVNGIWQQRFEHYQTHWEQTDSTHVKETPATKTELPWYKHWWQTIKDYLLIAAIIAVLLMSRNLWLPWSINFIKRIWNVCKAFFIH